MVGNHKVVTLCGSTKFKEDFLREQKRLTLQGCIVLSVGFFERAAEDGDCPDDIEALLGDLHKRKIDMSDEILIINKGGYIGASTRSEIEYAKERQIPVVYMEAPRERAASAYDAVLPVFENNRWAD